MSPHGNKPGSWHRIPLSPEQQEFGFASIIRTEMEELWISHGALEGVSIWLDDREGKSCIYFSPMASNLAGLLLFRFNGTPCKQPELVNLTFLMGHAFRDDTS